MGSSTVDYDLTTDADGNAVLAFSDIRAGGDLVVYAYLIAPDASFLWGPNGVVVSDNDDFEPAPSVVATTDGQYVVVWPNLDAGRLLLQRFDAAGVPEHPSHGVEIAGGGVEPPALQRAVASEDGAVIVSFVRDISSFLSPRHVLAQKIAPDGALVWGQSPIVVSDAASVAIAHQPRLEADGAGGAAIAWHDTRIGDFQAWPQRLNADGVPLWAEDGVAVTNETTRAHLNLAPV